MKMQQVSFSELGSKLYFLFFFFVFPLSQGPIGSSGGGSHSSIPAVDDEKGQINATFS